jgi:predicted esterase
MLKHLLAAAAIFVVPLALVACSDENDTSDGGDVYEVTTAVVSHETTQDIWVSAPDAEGPWPIIYALHGTGGTGDGLAATAGELARHGHVVFSPTWRTEMDAECSYRYALTIADQYGGDPDLGIAGIGHSLGAGVLLIGGLDDAAYAAGGTYDDCFTGGPRPSVLVPIAGCYYEYQDNEFAFDPVAFSGRDVDITLVVGNEDAECEPWQSRDATEKLENVGYDARLTEVDGGNHANVVFYEVVDGEWVTAPDDPIGEEVVEIILDAIEASR